jgi:NAD(P)H-nitrite reductase large subunit
MIAARPHNSAPLLSQLRLLVEGVPAWVSVEAVGEALKAGTNRGSCRAEIKGIVEANRLKAAE